MTAEAVRTEDGRYEVKFDFDRDPLVDGHGAGLVERSDPNREEQ